MSPELSPAEAIGAHEFSHRLSYLFGARVGESYVTSESTGITYLSFESADPLDHITRQKAALKLSRKGEAKVGVHDHSGCNHDHSVDSYLTAVVEANWGKDVASAVDKRADNLASAAIGSVSVKDLVEGGREIAIYSGFRVIEPEEPVFELPQAA